jgi:hypothetical protein
MAHCWGVVSLDVQALHVVLRDCGVGNFETDDSSGFLPIQRVGTKVKEAMIANNENN